MTQKIYPDPHGRGRWDQGRAERIFVHLIDARGWRALTAEACPTRPPGRSAYRRAGLPWFEVYDEHLGALKGSKALSKVKSLGALGEDLRDGSW